MPDKRKLVDLFYQDDSTLGETATEAEEFEELYTTGMQPADYGNAALGLKYKNWVEANKDRLMELYGDLNPYFY
jgi:hypothetical protein